MTHLTATFGQRLRQARKERGATLADVGHMVALSVSYLSEIERGIASPTLDQVDLFAVVLGESPAWLLGVDVDAGQIDQAERALAEVEYARDALAGVLARWRGPFAR